VGTYKTEGIILRKRKFGEADEIVTVFSKHRGKLKMIAKGVRKSTSRKRGNLELSNRCSLFLAEGKNLDLVTEVEVISSFSSLKKDLVKSVYCFQILEMVERLTVEEEAHRDIFELIVQTLDLLNSTTFDHAWGTADLVVIRFTIQLLHSLGFWNDEEVGGKYRISAIDLTRLKKLQVLSLPQIVKLDAKQEDQKRIRAFLNSYVREVAEHQMNSFQLLQQVEEKTLKI